MTRIEVDLPQPTDLVREMAPIVALARNFEVKDVETDRIAQEYGQKLRRAERSWSDYCEPARKAVDEANRKVLRLRDGILGPWAEARSVFFAKSDLYQREELRKAEEEQRRLQAEARRQEEERTILDAIDAEEAGDAAGAEAILAQPIEAPLVTVAPAVAKVKGVISQERWSAEVTDVRACLLFMAQRPEWAGSLERLVPELETILRPFAVSQRQTLSIPGVLSVSRQIRSTR